jgi:hypothetical protein
MVSTPQEQGNLTHSKPSVDGVSKALRFCVMLSSIEARDTRRKSNYYIELRIYRASGDSLPLRATVEKQNCGVSVSDGGGEGWAIMALGACFEASALEGEDQR